MGNLAEAPLAIDSKFPIVYVHLLAVDNIDEYGLCELMRDLDLLNPSTYLYYSSLNFNFPPKDHAEAFALIDQYSDLFYTGLYNLGSSNMHPTILILKTVNLFGTVPIKSPKLKRLKSPSNSNNSSRLGCSNTPRVPGLPSYSC